MSVSGGPARWRIVPPTTLCYWKLFLVLCAGGLGSRRWELQSVTPMRQVLRRRLRSVTVAGLAAGVSLHLAAMLHSTVVGHLHRFADVGFPALQHLLLV